MRIKRPLQIVPLAVVAFLLAGVSARADSFNVTITGLPSALSPLSPLVLGLDLTEAGLGVNNVTFSSFNFGSGAAQGIVSETGSVSGSLLSGVSIIGNGGDANLFEQFIPGSALSFQLTTTNITTSASTPDLIRVYVTSGIDSLCFPQPDLLSVYLTGQPLSPASFSVNGSCVTGLTATITTATGGGGGNGGGGGGTNVPEPSSVLLLGTGLLGLMGMGLYKKRLA